MLKMRVQDISSSAGTHLGTHLLDLMIKYELPQMSSTLAPALPAYLLSYLVAYLSLSLPHSPLTRMIEGYSNFGINVLQTALYQISISPIPDGHGQINTKFWSDTAHQVSVLCRCSSDVSIHLLQSPVAFYESVLRSSTFQLDYYLGYLGAWYRANSQGRCFL